MPEQKGVSDMGLDMYLYETSYLSHYEHTLDTPKGVIEHANAEKVLKAIGAANPIVEGGGSVMVQHTVAYWRKANQIHNWFVDNVQEGADDCGEYEVGVNNLRKLVNLCKRVIKTRDTTDLPPASGFFFGSTEIDEWYWKDLENTIEMLDPIIERSLAKAKENQEETGFPSSVWFKYHSSW